MCGPRREREKKDGVLLRRILHFRVVQCSRVQWLPNPPPPYILYVIYTIPTFYQAPSNLNKSATYKATYQPAQHLKVIPQPGSHSTWYMVSAPPYPSPLPLPPPPRPASAFIVTPTIFSFIFTILLPSNSLPTSNRRGKVIQECTPEAFSNFGFDSLVRSDKVDESL